MIKTQMKNKIKILFLANNTLSPESGGIERTTFSLITHLAKNEKYDIIVVFKEIPVKIKNVICIEKIIYNGKDIYEIISEFSINIVIFPCGAWYTNLLKQFNPNVNCKIITCLHSPPKAGESAVISNVNYDFKKSNFIEKLKILPKYAFTYMKHPFLLYRSREHYKKGYVNSNAYVLLSKTYSEVFRKHAKLNEISKLYAIGNALSFSEIDSNVDLDKKENNVLVVSRFDEISKRISLALKSWNQVKFKENWQMQIVGFGKDEQYYKDLVINENIQNVDFKGKQNPITYYQKAKIFLMTSAFEGWGMTITESLQMGVVPIAMDSFSSLHDIIEDNYNGYIVKNGDFKEMAKKINFLMNNEEELKRLSINAIESSKKFTIENIGLEWESLFEQLLIK